jgi:putative transcriptional regulator
MNKSIGEVVHETALGLHEAGAMKQKTLREIESLCLPQVKKREPNQVDFEAQVGKKT